MIDKNDFDGGLVFGPADFAAKTGRNRVWEAGEEPQVIDCRHRSCPQCGRGQSRELFTFCRDGKNTFDYVLCDCGMIFTQRAPTPDALDFIYRNAPAQRAWLEVQDNDIEREIDMKKFRWALEMAGWPVEAGKILDIGCSTGTMLEVAQDMSSETFKLGAVFRDGIEVNETAALLAKKKGIRIVDWVGGDIGIESYDLVSLWEVLEHVHNPRELLWKAWATVKPGGKLVICVPNANSYAFRMLRAEAPMCGLGHINLWTPKTLRDLLLHDLRGLEQCDFETIISWSREMTNWLAFKGPTKENASQVEPWLQPEVVHEALAGYKLVAFATKGAQP